LQFGDGSLKNCPRTISAFVGVSDHRDFYVSDTNFCLYTYVRTYVTASKTCHIWDRCYDFLNCRKIWRKNGRFWHKLLLAFANIWS
jgi:hypothetical protein